MASIEDTTATAPPARSLRVMLSNEPLEITDNLAGRANYTVALFSSPLVALKDGVPFGLLSNAPELNTDTWKVFPDGRMETTYRLRANLTWHDGAPLTADDLVFTYRLLKAKIDYNLALQINMAEFNAIEAVLAPTPDTYIIRWRTVWVEAATPSFRTLGPFAKHLLSDALEKVDVAPEGLANHLYWTTGYVGTGPYRMTNWERGAFIEGTAFDGYVFGRPKIEKVVVSWNEPNVVVTRLLAKDGDLALGFALRISEAVTLRREWAATGARSGDGLLILIPTADREIIAQLRPAYANPRGLLDLRVRKASMHALDRQALVEGLLEGEGVIADSFANPLQPYYVELNRLVTKYPYDLRRTDELMAQAGFAKGADGMYAAPPGEGRFAPEVLGVAEGQDGRETTAVADFFRRAGIDAQLRLEPASRLNTSDELKATFPAWRSTYATTPDKFYGPQIASPENQWRGLNKPGWLNSENDRLVDRLQNELDIKERNQLFVAVHRNMMEDLPGLPLYFALGVTAYLAELEGPTESRPGTSDFIDLHQWRWAR
jgi:peptide/nickel transport system substrate-binding protein